METEKKSIYEDDTCPECGLKGKFIPPSREKGEKVYVDFECSKGHKYTKEFVTK
jgi:hypothetical protein